MGPPKLAIIITSYNYENYVGRAIRSVIDQQHPDCEVFVVDDGSTDRSWDVIQASGVRAVQLRNGGQRLACIEGLKHTTAPFVLFFDCDDELKPGSLGTIVAQLDAGVSKLQFALEIVDAEGQPMPGAAWPLDRFRARETLAGEVLRRGVYKTPPTSGNVFRRDVCALLDEADYDRAGNAGTLSHPWPERFRIGTRAGARPARTRARPLRRAA
jgi:glycosyltransferase involved in cell wall biosynthesis